MQLEKQKAEIDQICAAGGGLVKPEAIVEFAKNPQTVLHGYFEWSDTEAGRLYRLEQARQLIRLHVVILPETIDPVRAFVSLPSDRVQGNGYRRIEDVVNDASRLEELVRDALERLLAAKRRYQHLTALQTVWRAIDEAAAQVKAGEEKTATG